MQCIAAPSKPANSTPLTAQLTGLSLSPSPHSTTHTPSHSQLQSTGRTPTQSPFAAITTTTIPTTAITTSTARTTAATTSVGTTSPSYASIVTQQPTQSQQFKASSLVGQPLIPRPSNSSLYKSAGVGTTTGINTYSSTATQTNLTSPSKARWKMQVQDVWLDVSDANNVKLNSGQRCSVTPCTIWIGDERYIVKFLSSTSAVATNNSISNGRIHLRRFG